MGMMYQKKDKIMELEATQRIMMAVYMKVQPSYRELFEFNFGRLPNGLEDYPLYLKVVWHYYEDNLIEASPALVTANEIFNLSKQPYFSKNWTDEQRQAVEEYHGKIINKFQNDMKIG